MEVRPITVEEYDVARADVVDFWDDDRTRFMHQTMFVHEFGDTCLAAVEGDRVVGYMVAFRSQTAPVGYIHLVGVRKAWRKRGVARALYEHFADLCRVQGCTHLKAITARSNELSVQFHLAMGFEPTGAGEEHGIAVELDYGGPDVHRAVFRRALEDRTDRLKGVQLPG